MGEIGGTEGHSSASANEKCRNKRKCSSDLTFHPPDLPPSLSMTEFPKYELLEQHFQSAFRQLSSILEKSKDLSKDKKVEKHEVDDAEWDDPITFQLEELLSSLLSTTFASAAKKLVGCGYTEETAEWAILNSSNFNGTNDAESSIFEGALALLKMNEHVKMPKKTVFEGLRSLVEYTLLEMIHVVRELRPELTVTEVMWCLLVSDMDLATACGLRWSPEEAHGGSPVELSGKLGALKPGDPRAQIFHPETPTVGPAQYRKPGPGPVGSRKEASISLQELKARFPGIADMDEKPGAAGGNKKAPAIHFKRDLLRQKAVHFEKNYRGRLTKGSFKAKVAAWGSMVLDQTLKSQSGVVMMENYSRLSISEQEEKNIVNRQLADIDPVSAFPARNPGTCRGGGEKVVKFPDPPKEPTNYYAQIPFDEILQEYVAKDEKDKLLLMIVPLKAELERELQGWCNWANEKVMQAAGKLMKEHAELKTLRQEKEDIEKSKKDKQTVEESMVKRLAEMDNALANTTGQIELTSCTVRRLEVENNVLRREMEDARMEARGSAVKLEEAVAKEQEMMKKLQVCEVEKGLMVEKLSITRREKAELESRIGKMKNRQNQFKVLLRQEEKERVKAEKLLDSLRGEREKVETLMKAEVDNINRTAQVKKHKFEEDIKNLQSMISELKMESDKEKIAALSAGYGPNVPKYRGERMAVFQEIFGTGDVKEERECVMCMTDEISVVFLPCAHQVLCGSCNALHEKEGMKDCPSCRETIKKRVSVSFRE
ncbi:Putative E3 ubiquitin-protein ligase RF298 [Striga hermonthica]|uniref:E3 ubiquitin-protein ligase RF298 n=1 Tax=Striga hermonthica TaxID=68872 RepID=A0A9N7N3A0_STRHE|nr:Putative E3 ubiquitin-protein ligase RF298 [Striga hermonthica]